MERIKGLKDEIIVRCKEKFNEAVDIGENGQLLVDSRFDPSRSIRMWGEVKQIPTIMTDRIILALGDNNVQRPSNKDFSVDMKYVTYADLPTPVEIGDKAWFHWNALLNKQHNITEDFYRIKYESMICVHKFYEVIGEGDDARIYKINPFSDERMYEITDDSIFSDDDYYFEQENRTFCRRTVMCNGYVLCRPDMESWDDIVSDGVKLKMEPQEKNSYAFVEHIGEKIKNYDELPLKKGDHILYYHKNNWKVHIDGDLFFVLRSKHIYGLVNSSIREA